MNAAQRATPVTGGEMSSGTVASTQPAPGQSRLRGFGRKFAEPSIPFAVTLPTGEVVRLGQGEPRFHLTLKNQRAMRAIATLDEGRFGDAYVSGDIDLDGDMLCPFELRRSMRDIHPLVAAWRFVEPVLSGQVRTNRRAISAHYDLEPAFFLSFLDPKVPSYTQGIFADPAEPLDVAALRKFDYCYDRCGLKPGDHVLEIGPGWGAWLEYATRRGLRSTAVSNSRVSVDYLARRAHELGADWQLRLADILEYEPHEKYDAIVMMGVIEHLPDYRRMLERFLKLIKPGGHVFIDGSAATKKYELSTFMVKYIFGGNHSFMVLHDLMDKIARTPFEPLEIHNDRMNYYLTFRHWAANLERNREFIVGNFTDFNYRRFRLYLWGAAYEFLSRNVDCYRLVIRAPGA
jgi:cyclopropane-fatty-acyl-phospholipid synthase